MNKLTDNLSEKQRELLKNFFKILVEENEKINLTSITEEKEVYIKHFEDSLSGAEFFPAGAKVIEIGSGGGFPSIPLKIARDDLNFTLLEATGKKCEYLKKTGEKLGFNGFIVLNGRAEDYGKKPLYREKFDVVTARAVARLNSLAEYCIPFVKVGGFFIAYKGDAEEEIREAEKAIEVLGCEKVEEKIFELSENYGKRRVIVYKKVKNTPPEYPRGNGKEKKNPIKAESLVGNRQLNKS